MVSSKITGFSEPLYRTVQSTFAIMSAFPGVDGTTGVRWHALQEELEDNVRRGNLKYDPVCHHHQSHV